LDVLASKYLIIVIVQFLNELK